MSVLFSSDTVTADELNPQMKKTYKAFKQLQPYLANEKAFRSDDNTDAVSELIQSLQDDFHSIDSIESTYQSEPGFKENLRIIDEILDDTSQRFKEGNKLYARWQLKGISNNCISCHISHNAPFQFDDVENGISELNSFDKGEFYLATRQFGKARQAFSETLKSGDLKSFSIFALRKWLVSSIRLNETPRKIREDLMKILESSQLPPSDKKDGHIWIGYLDEWINEKSKESNSFKKGEELITQAIANAPRSDRVNRINLLRGTSMLHDLLENRKLPSELRKKSLLLLGIAYLELRLFFIDELPDIYLRQCINEYPGTVEARQAYSNFREKILEDYTGTGGLDLPPDVTADLRELYYKAHNIPYFEGRVRVHVIRPREKQMEALLN